MRREKRESEGEWQKEGIHRERRIDSEKDKNRRAEEKRTEIKRRETEITN